MTTSGKGKKILNREFQKAEKVYKSWESVLTVKALTFKVAIVLE